MLSIKGTFLDSKVARRIFFLFLIAALLPISILTFFSVKQLNILTTQSVNDALRQSAKSYGLLINDRLNLLNDQLIHHFSREPLPNLGLSQNTGLDSFTQFHTFTINNSSYLTENKLPALTSIKRKFLQQGNPLLVTQFQENLPAKLYLLHSIDNTDLIVMGLINPDALWGRPDTFDDSKGFCIYGAENEQLFCSQLQLDTQLQTVQAEWTKSTTGNLRITEGKQTLLVGYWSLFIKPRFLYPNLTIAITEDQQRALAPTSGLIKLFIAVSLLTLVIIVFLSTIQIRRYLTPIKALMRGIQRIAKNDFSFAVKVKSNDEFSQLASSFNSMSKQISQHFEFLTTMSVIDQSILSNQSVNEILSTIISLSNKAVSSKTVHIAMINETAPDILDVYSEDIQHIHGMSQSTHTIVAADRYSLVYKKTAIYRIHDNNFPAYLTPLIEQNIVSFILVPIVCKETLTAILIFGFKKIEYSSETHIRLRELGDRFAIALERSAWNTQLYLQANYDPLTKLPNRQLLSEHLQHAIKHAIREKSHFSLMFLDLDRFKIVNDSLGHSSGDKLLKMVADRLIDILREDDTIARLGGDEFVIFQTTSLEEELYPRASLIATKILHALSEAYIIDKQEIHISASIGIVSFPSDGEDIGTLLKNADSAMYHAKKEGGNNFQFYSQELNEKALQQLKMETQLHNAITNNEFQMYYQAKVDTQSGKILGAEALIRWLHPTQGLIPPFQFMPIAEKSGLIKIIGEWTLRETCRQNKLWQQQGLSAITVSVNISPIQFQQPNLVNIVEQALDDAELKGMYLNLEILEGTEMHNSDHTITVLEQLKNLGVGISVDDYGTGYSTLSYLKKFPIDVLKIDMSFIRNLVNDLADQAIVSSTILLAHNLGLSVVAEGVEHDQQLAILRSFGCDEVQGYYFSRPIPANEFTKLLEKGFIDPNQQTVNQ